MAAAREERGRLLADSLAASDRERRTIARDLHDGVVQDLAGVGYMLGAIEHTAALDANANARRMLELSAHTVQRSVHGLRNLAVDIRPPDLASGGLANALRALAARANVGERLSVRVNVGALGEVSPPAAAAIYRCARECLVNIVKHAEAGIATIELQDRVTTLRLQVSDNGRGMPTNQDRPSDNRRLGLVFLEEAARDLGGKLSITSELSGGTIVTFEIPRNADPDQ